VRSTPAQTGNAGVTPRPPRTRSPILRFTFEVSALGEFGAYETADGRLWRELAVGEETDEEVYQRVGGVIRE
jgi:hypothetical protein